MATIVLPERTLRYARLIVAGRTVPYRIDLLVAYAVTLLALVYGSIRRSQD